MYSTVQYFYRFLHVTDNLDPEGQTDPLRKVRFLVDHLQEKFVELYNPDEHISIDEGTLGLDLNNIFLAKNVIY